MVAEFIFLPGQQIGHVFIKSVLVQGVPAIKSRYAILHQCCEEEREDIMSHRGLLDLWRRVSRGQVTRCRACECSRRVDMAEWKPSTKPYGAIPIAHLWPIPPSLRPVAAGAARP